MDVFQNVENFMKPVCRAITGSQSLRRQALKVDNKIGFNVGETLANIDQGLKQLEPKLRSGELEDNKPHIKAQVQVLTHAVNFFNRLANAFQGRIDRILDITKPAEAQMVS